MKAEIRDQWIEALKSDKYPRAAGRLRRGLLDITGEPLGVDGFCPLGVLGDLAVQAGVATWTAEPRQQLLSGSVPYSPNPDDLIWYLGNADGVHSRDYLTLPDHVRDWCDLAWEQMCWNTVQPETNMVIWANDGAGHTFPEIADLIYTYIPATP